MKKNISVLPLFASFQSLPPSQQFVQVSRDLSQRFINWILSPPQWFPSLPSFLCEFPRVIICCQGFWCSKQRYGSMEVAAALVTKLPPTQLKLQKLMPLMWPYVSNALWRFEQNSLKLVLSLTKFCLLRSLIWNPGGGLKIARRAASDRYCLVLFVFGLPSKLFHYISVGYNSAPGLKDW